MVGESFLVHLSVAWLNSEDSEMREFSQLARSDDPHFRIIYKFSVALLAKQVHSDAPLQFVIS